MEIIRLSRSIFLILIDLQQFIKSFIDINCLRTPSSSVAFSTCMFNDGTLADCNIFNCTFEALILHFHVIKS